jgi:uncharacterized protein (DUF952 family)
LLAFAGWSCKPTGVRDCVYRICPASDWAQTTATGQLPLTPDDLRDGYVHLSKATQVAGTLRRFFAGREDLVLLSICCERLTDGELRFEGAGEGSEHEVYPHFYGRIGLDVIFEAEPLSLDEHGQHRLPAPLIQSIASATDARNSP